MALNLEQHRGAENVWDRAVGAHGWDAERWLLAVMAGGFLISGLRRRSVGGLMMVLGGSAFAWWAAAGADERNHLRGQFHAALPTFRAADDRVGEASEESFPASDAPSWTPPASNTRTGHWH